MNPQLHEFYQRLRRIDRIHRRGGGFEAAGTLGQSFYTRLATRPRRSYARPALMVVVAMIGAKAVLLATHGPADYDARLDRLSQGSPAERIGGYVMGVDPITAALAAALAPALAR